MILEAKNSGTVKIEGISTDVKNITGSKSPSTGVVIAFEDQSIYLPNNIDDFKAILDSLKDLAGLTLTSSLQPNPANTSLIEALKLKIDKIKEELK